MTNKKLWIVITILFSITGFIWFKAITTPKVQILGESDLVDNTELQQLPKNASNPSPIPTQKPTTTPKPSPTLYLLPIPTKTSERAVRYIPPTFTDEQINGFIDRFAGQYGIDVNVLRHLATCESGFDEAATNGEYAGLFQFAVNSWETNRVAMGEEADPNLRFNAEEATQTAAYMIANGKGSLWPNCMP